MASGFTCCDISPYGELSMELHYRHTEVLWRTEHYGLSYHVQQVMRAAMLGTSHNMIHIDNAFYVAILIIMFLIAHCVGLHCRALWPCYVPA